MQISEEDYIPESAAKIREYLNERGPSESEEEDDEEDDDLPLDV